MGLKYKLKVQGRKKKWAPEWPLFLQTFCIFLTSTVASTLDTRWPWPCKILESSSPRNKVAWRLSRWVTLAVNPKKKIRVNFSNWGAELTFAKIKIAMFFGLKKDGSSERLDWPCAVFCYGRATKSEAQPSLVFLVTQYSLIFCAMNGRVVCFQRLALTLDMNLSLTLAVLLTRAVSRLCWEAEEGLVCLVTNCSFMFCSANGQVVWFRGWLWP